jgi:hypothetical protein
MFPALRDGGTRYRASLSPDSARLRGVLGSQARCRLLDALDVFFESWLLRRFRVEAGQNDRSGFVRSVRGGIGYEVGGLDGGDSIERRLWRRLLARVIRRDRVPSREAQ